MTGCRRPRRLAAPQILVLAALAAGCAQTGSGVTVTADPDALIGLAPQQIGERLGAPELQRQEPPAEVWQYRTATCVFDLYLYDEEGGPRAVHYETRSRSNGAVDPAECLGSVVERNRLASRADSGPVDPARL